jgi:hypothetical protein
MKEELISFETAKLAHEKGFNIYTSKFYDKHGDLQVERPSFDLTTNEGNVAAPTQSLLQKWLREEKNQFIEIEGSYRGDRILEVVEYSNVVNICEVCDGFETYEDALEDALLKALTSIYKFKK